MKTLIISLLLFLTANAQNVWYVNGANTSGTYNGRSWATGWQYFDSSSWAGPNGINWNIIQPGDTIYVSGGVDSLTYTANTFYGFWITPPVRRDFRSGNPPVITRAWQPGHNGVVRLVATGGSNGQQGILRVRNVNNIKIRGLVIEDRRTAGGVNHVVLGEYSDDSHYYFEDNHLIGIGNTTILHFGGYHITARGNILEHLLNNNIADCDIITVSGGGGSFTIDRNILIQRNTNTVTDAHRDMIQISNLYGDVNVRIPIIISNNLIIVTEPQGTSWNNMIYNYGWDVTPRIDMRIYNNILVNRIYQSSIGAFGIGRLDGNNPLTVRIFNNTVINKGWGSQSGLVANWGTDTLIVYNNLFVADTTHSVAINLDNLSIDYFNYNYYARYGASQSSFATKGINYSWTTWRGTGQDANSTLGSNTSVIFQNKYGTNIEDYYTETGRGLGINLYNQYPYLRYDILGNPRPETGAWDIGALQYQGGPSVNFHGKIFLQGPSNGNLMKTYLADSCACIPLQQPYNTAPWNYAGNESIVFPNGQPGSGYIDWVLVELRSASNPVQVVGRRAAILRNDGRLLDTDGTPGVKFSNTNSGAYYVAVFHRNHLAVMSANPLQLSANTQLYDFTNSMNKAYGINPMADLGNGYFAMFSGDGNSNGGVNIHDRNAVWSIQNGTQGYLNGDFNLDGGVNAIDAALWSSNNGSMTQVP